MVSAMVFIFGWGWAAEAITTSNLPRLHEAEVRYGGRWEKGGWLLGKKWGSTVWGRLFAMFLVARPIDVHIVSYYHCYDVSPQFGIFFWRYLITHLILPSI